MTQAEHTIQIDLRRADVALLEAAMQGLGYTTRRDGGRFIEGVGKGPAIGVDGDRGWILAGGDYDGRTDEVRRAFAAHVLRWAAELHEWNVFPDQGRDGFHALQKLRPGSDVEVDILEDGTMDVRSARGDYQAIHALLGAVAGFMGGGSEAGASINDDLLAACKAVKAAFDIRDAWTGGGVVGAAERHVEMAHAWKAAMPLVEAAIAGAKAAS